MTVAYQRRDRSKKERQRDAIVQVLGDIYPHGASSHTIRDRIYDRLGHATPCTATVGRFCHELTAEGWVTFEASQAMSPTYTWFLSSWGASV